MIVNANILQHIANVYSLYLRYMSANTSSYIFMMMMASPLRSLRARRERLFKTSNPIRGPFSFRATLAASRHTQPSSRSDGFSLAFVHRILYILFRASLQFCVVWSGSPFGSRSCREHI